ncbi:Amidohydrolase family protein [Pedobacter steynii]|uniref:Amidohydrolase family protein n=1 Tax=Pedobacter steynii TaxID=430522 RepID=A0A1H0KI77_9SPHI|nr:amidohydrolase family protein [Pedobacter steynii]NQX43296.1 amidohydrolase family protein [Pedobacter steynii]SDO55506.1 Amidohydrolase family protein [Pedobacter steynii]
MKLKLSLLSFVLMALTCHTFAQQAHDLIIKDVNILSMRDSNLLIKRSVLIQKGKIVRIDDFKNLRPAKGVKVISAEGKFLMPGLAEMHSHFPAEGQVDTLLLENVAAGVTHIRIMNSGTSQVAIRERLKKSPDLISPKLHYSQLIRKDIRYSVSQFDSLMMDMKKNGISFIKLLSLADEETFDNLMKSANKNKVTVCGHFPRAVSLEKVLNSGYKSIEHLAGYDGISDETQLEKMISLTKDKAVYNCPTLDWDLFSMNLQYPDDYKKRLTYASSPKQYRDKWEKEYAAEIEKKGKEKVLAGKEAGLAIFARKQQLLKKLSDKGCLLLAGSDAGNSFQMNGFNMHEEMWNWSLAGIGNFKILQSATVTPSMFFNEQDSWGTVEVGKSADLIILSKNPMKDIRHIRSVETTIIDGKVYFPATFH